MPPKHHLGDHWYPHTLTHRIRSSLKCSSWWSHNICPMNIYSHLLSFPNKSPRKPNLVCYSHISSLAPNDFSQQTTLGCGKLLACFRNQIHLSKDDDLPPLRIFKECDLGSKHGWSMRPWCRWQQHSTRWLTAWKGLLSLNRHIWVSGWGKNQSRQASITQVGKNNHDTK